MRTNPFTFLSWMIVWYQFKIQRWWRLVQTTFMTWFDDIDETLLERWEDAPWWKKSQQMSHWVNPTFWILFDGCRKTVFTGVENRFHSFLFLWHKSKMILFRDFLCPLCSINLCVRPLMDSPNKKCGPIFFAFYSRYSSGDDHDSTPDFLEQCSNFCSGS